MPEHQASLPFDLSYQPAPGAPPEMRDEIAHVWGLPIGAHAEITLRDESLDTVSGLLELVSTPDFPWNPRQPLQLRVNGFVFDSRAIERWTCL